MGLYTLLTGIIFFLMTITGIVGNLLVLAVFLHSALYDCKLKKAEIILVNLAASNLLVFLTGGVPNFLYVFGVKNVFNDIGCKLIVFIFRASRALTIMLTSFLSCFQSVIICTSSLSWVPVKQILQTYVVHIISFLYTLSTTLSINLIVFTSSHNNSSIPKYSFTLGYCIVVHPDQITMQGTGYFILARDLLFVILMASSSAYILFVLYRHARKAKEIRSHDPSSKPAAESHAAKTDVVENMAGVHASSVKQIISMAPLPVYGCIQHTIGHSTYLNIQKRNVYTGEIQSEFQKFRGHIKASSQKLTSFILLKKKTKMELYTLLTGILFFLLAITGIVGNLLVLALFLHSALYDCKLKKAEIILEHLAASSLIVCLTGGVPNFLHVFGVKNFISDIGCKLVVYVFRAIRCLTIMLTSFLSCFQCVIICTSSLRWTCVKHTLQKYIVPIISFLYTLSMVLNINLTFSSFSSVSYNSSIPKYSFSLGYCIVVYPDQTTMQGVGFFTLARDLLFVIVMASTSAYILFVLYRHARKAKEIRTHDPSPKPAAESHAAKTVITLVTLYVSLFGIDSLIWFYQLTIAKEVLRIITDIRYFFSMCYTSLFPFVICILNPKVRGKLQHSIPQHDAKIQEVADCSHDPITHETIARD
ncbi:uncharacterized protein LOC122805788 [Protopterus annectens]|uniref:uncharacterized protein LOC122805788 n=1 Tax=Protopterus annectens TaxID=7888 RepID=UPI001CF95018|nr:uncharacterized protein LOC122805788 [Protopterus annectens]